MQKLTKMDKDEMNKEILDLLRNRSALKRNVFELTTKQFNQLKVELKNLAENWEKEVKPVDGRLEIVYKDLGAFYCQLTIAGDVLLFVMHTNVFQFDANSRYWKSGYLQEDPNRGYCGTIQVYNFLADSFRFNRQEDVGYMVARIFINHENHFFVQGKKRLGYLFDDFINSELTSECIQKVVMAAVLYTLKFDLYTPEYRAVQQVSLKQFTQEKDTVGLRTGKRLGYQFSAPEEDIEG